MQPFQCSQALQEDIFTDIKKKFIELEDLSKSRIKEVELYLKERDRIDAVRTEYTEMCKVWDAHMELINGTTHSVEVATNGCVDFVGFFEQVPPCRSLSSYLSLSQSLRFQLPLLVSCPSIAHSFSLFPSAPSTLVP